MSAATHSSKLPPAYFVADVDDFVSVSEEVVLGQLAAHGSYSLEVTQRNAWVEEIRILRTALRGLAGRLFLEFDVPRIGSRIDAVLVTDVVVIPMEFKVGETEYRTADITQAWDYALDLKNFHKASHHAPICPILIATEAQLADAPWPNPADDGVYPPFLTNQQGLPGLLARICATFSKPAVDPDVWGNSPYYPTPTIIEAAQSLYGKHSVEAIARNDAGAKNLSETSAVLEQIIRRAAENQTKAIVFVTGVPGAGKTLVGLNVATRKRDKGSDHAVFLSGNGPLVRVLTEALARDEVTQTRQAGGRVSKSTAKQKIKAFIQNVHHFRDAGLRDIHPPADRVVIFDEAQRAWDHEMTARFMAQKKNVPGFAHSEPEFLISYMDRHDDWAVIICLVGGGQEIHTGEAGIASWLDAVRRHFPHWLIYLSAQLTDSEYAATGAIDRLDGVDGVHKLDELHLSVSMRSFRAEAVSKFVKTVLDCEIEAAQHLLTQVSGTYPIRVTRDLVRAKDWVRSQARGSERYGLVASSSAQRLKPHAIDVRVNVDPVHWFLSGSDDTRSSLFLEDAATEFQVQGLELDWACVSWDADLRFAGNGWEHCRFRGNRWTAIRQERAQNFLRNAYRVLLTRARQGMVIFIPRGDERDPTRRPTYYDATYEYLRRIGLSEL